MEMEWDLFCARCLHIHSQRISLPRWGGKNHFQLRMKKYVANPCENWMNLKLTIRKWENCLTRGKLSSRF